MTRPGATSLAAQGLRLVLAAGFLFLLAASLPGHLSYDSIAQLHEGRAGVRETWGPAMYAWLLGAFDAIVPGTGIYVTVSALVLLGALLGLRTLRPRTSWLAVAVAAALVLTPQLMVYQAIVWKDVMFANCAVAGFVCLAHAAQRWDERPLRWAALVAAMLFLAMGALVRQNGALAIPFAALALGWTARRDGWKRALAWGVGGLVATLVVMKLLGLAVEPPSPDADPAIGRGIRIVAQYDIIGAVAHAPGLPLERVHAADPNVEAVIRRAAAGVYSAERVDTLDRAPETNLMWTLPDAVLLGQWGDIILRHPGAYLAHRLDVFRWLAAPPVIDRCLPLYVGTNGPDNLLRDLRLVAGDEPQDLQLYNYGTWFFDTPIYSHVLYMAICVLVLAGALWRRAPADWVVAAMMGSALAFTASFLVISIACDNRYLYFLDIAAMAGLLYLALDPPWRRRDAAA
jgi:4-amino-4-deoxy-L-arabinose transferase-like glycosyltransferase